MIMKNVKKLFLVLSLGCATGNLCAGAQHLDPTEVARALGCGNNVDFLSESLSSGFDFNAEVGYYGLGQDGECSVIKYACGCLGAILVNVESSGRINSILRKVEEICSLDLDNDVKWNSFINEEIANQGTFDAVNLAIKALGEVERAFAENIIKSILFLRENGCVFDFDEEIIYFDEQLRRASGFKALSHFFHGMDYIAIASWRRRDILVSILARMLKDNGFELTEE